MDYTEMVQDMVQWLYFFNSAINLEFPQKQ
jgi:hypothetical protein